MNLIDFIMAGRHYRKGVNRYAVLLNQKNLIEQHYSFLRSEICNNVLICTGTIPIGDYKYEYKVEIRYVCGHEPLTKILKPEDILPSHEIHMYQDHSLCLHYPKDMKWTASTEVYRYTIPWVVEWIVYYELFLENGGIWEGPESPVHFRESERNIGDEQTALRLEERYE